MLVINGDTSKSEVRGMEMNDKKNNKNLTALGEIEEEIRKKQEELNRIVLEGNDREYVLKFSQELDVLISKYLSIKAG
ncbi:MAG: Spo0E family sporulation regulatory protein-aspartic acid phosphatase [Tissierellia bacterium]|nr:Spo0E family sporulation regulatory protein-aspartic acid phosphatase [Tissierellia bacterium]